jgi:hypothetical protein
MHLPLAQCRLDDVAMLPAKRWTPASSLVRHHAFAASQRTAPRGMRTRAFARPETYAGSTLLAAYHRAMRFDSRTMPP